MDTQSTKPVIQAIEYERRYNISNFEHEIIKLSALLPPDTTDPKPFVRMLQNAADGLTRQSENYREVLNLKTEKEIKEVFRAYDLGGNNHAHK